jgi:hypothetical protein
MIHRHCGFARLVLLVALVSFVAVGSAEASSINWGDYVGTDVTYSTVTESSNTGDTLPLYGRPTVLGPAPPGQTPCVACTIPANSLDFTPSFSAFSNPGNGHAPDQTDGQLNFMVTAHPGKAIQNIHFFESGDTSLLGFSPSIAFTSMAMFGHLNIITVDNVGIDVPRIDFQMTFTLTPSNAPTDGTFILGSVDEPYPSYSTQWKGELLVDLTANNPAVAQIFADRGLNPTLGVTKITVVFDNVLQALTTQGAAAFIAKKDQLIITTNIPEPTALGLAMISLVLGGFAIRRR